MSLFGGRGMQGVCIYVCQFNKEAESENMVWSWLSGVLMSINITESQT